MNERQTFHAALAMESGKHGSFAEFIGRAYIVADEYNRARIIGAFSDLFARVHDFHQPDQPQLEIVK